MGQRVRERRRLGGLAPGAHLASRVTVDSQLGYTGTEPRADMMNNSQFVDAKVAALREVRLHAMGEPRRVSRHAQRS